MQILTTSENAARRAAEDAERVKDLLTLDKSYLQQENRAWQAKYEEKSRSVEAGQSQSLALELKVAQLTDQLLSLQLTARTGFDERMDKEIQRLRFVSYTIYFLMVLNDRWIIFCTFPVAFFNLSLLFSAGMIMPEKWKH